MQEHFIKRNFLRLKRRLTLFLASRSFLEQLIQSQDQVLKTNTLLFQKQKEFKSLINNFSEGVCIHKDGIILYVNHVLTKNLKYQSSLELIGCSIYDVMVAPEFVETVKKRSFALSTSEDFVNPLMEFEVLTRNPEIRFFAEVTSMSIVLDNEKCAIVIFRDVSERKKLQAQTMTADRMIALGHVAAGIGHEINNPLCYVMLNIEMLAESLAAHDLTNSTKQIATIQKGLGRIKTIISDLKSVSRGTADEVLTNVDVNSVLESVLAITRNDIQTRAILKYSPSVVEPIYIDETRLAQVLLNIIINASQAIQIGMVDENLIQVKTYMNSHHQVVIEISDTGTGMSEDVQKRIFEPFFTTKAIGVGTGLGLAICQNIVNQFHGTIELKSMPNVGTVFHIIFPASEEVMTMKSNAIDIQPKNKKLKGQVLMIDDDADLLEVLEEIVSVNHDSICFTNAQTALEVLKDNATYDCIICDLMMPKMSGIEFFSSLKKVAPHYLERIIFLTGGSVNAETDQFLASPGITYCEKPINTKLLLKKIADHVESSKKLQTDAPETILKKAG